MVVVCEGEDPVGVFDEIAIIVVAIHIPDKGPLFEVCLAGDGFGLFFDSCEGGHKYSH